MAEVKMDLTELKALEDSRDKWQNLSIKHEITIKEKEQEIVKVLADKRTVKTTIKVVPKKKFEYNFRSDSFHMNMDYPIDMRKRYSPETEASVREICKHLSHAAGKEYYHNIEPIIADVLERYLRKEVKIDTEEITTTEYVNFDDVLVDIRAKVEQSVATEISGYKKTISDLQDKVTNSSITENKKTQQLIETYELKIKELGDAFNKQYKALEKEYQDFRERRETRSLEKQIRDLKLELEQERARKWYQNRKKK